MDDTLLCGFIECARQPGGQQLEIGSDLQGYLRRQERELTCQQGTDAKWPAAIADAFRPVISVGMKLVKWVGYVLLEDCNTSFSLPDGIG